MPSLQLIRSQFDLKLGGLFISQHFIQLGVGGVKYSVAHLAGNDSPL